jgi:phosphoadenosine phosphosulfate reductase
VKKGLLPSQKIRWCCEEFKENAGAGKVTLIGIRHAESSRRAKRNEVEVSSKAFSGTLEQFDEFREKRLKNNRVRKMVLPKPSVAHPESVQNESVVGCITGKESILISPIIHWTEQDVWEFLNEVVNVPHCSLYDNGHKRIGCILCPMSNYKQKMRDLKDYPHAKRCWIRAIKTIRGGGLSQHSYTDENKELTTAYGRSYHRAFLFSPSGEDAGGADKEDIIAENIFDWWISGKAYDTWYAEKFLQQKLFQHQTITAERH